MPLIDGLIKNGYLRTEKIISAFRKIKRYDFIRPEEINLAEINAPLGIGYGQTISQPATVAFMLEKLQPMAGEKILDVGAGSGWTAAILAEIAGAGGKVYALERIEDLKNYAVDNINKYSFINKGTVQVFCTDGYKGLPGMAPFDKILVSAAAKDMPEELFKQLKVGGRLILPIGEQAQAIAAIDKITEDKFKKIEYPGFIFVPLIKD